MVRKLNYSLSKLNYSICLGALTNNIKIIGALNLTWDQLIARLKSRVE